MGGRQSSQSGNNRSHPSSAQESSNVRYSLSSIENVPSGNRTNSLFSAVSGSNLDFSTPPARGVGGRRRRGNRGHVETHSLPSHLFPAFLAADIKCPVCNKRIGSDEIESHLLVCLSKPRVSYNEDVLKSNAGECIICFDDMEEGDHIARLPCLCIYHKKCLDDWFQRNRCCPEHPDQIPNQDFSTAENTPSASNTSIRNNGTDLTSQSNLQSASNDDSELVGATAASPEELRGETLQSDNINQRDILLPSQVHNFDNEQTSRNISIPPLGNLEIEMGQESDDVVNDSLNQNETQLSPISEASQSSQHSTHEEFSSSGRPIIKHRTVVHVDEGSIHGSPTLFDEEELAQLASKIKTIYVTETPRSTENADHT